MAKQCVLYDVSGIMPRRVYIDFDIAEELFDFISDAKIKKKFDYVVNQILNQPHMHYENYVQLSGFKNITEIRLFPNGINARIYCKEININGIGICVIAAKLLPKKSKQKIDKSIIQIIKPIENYEYEIRL